VAAAESTDGMAALSEFKTMGLGGGLDVREHVLLNGAGIVVGYSQAAWHASDAADGHWAIEVVAGTGYRHSEAVLLLIDAMRSDLGGGRITLWARSDFVGKAALAGGWFMERKLWEMRRSLPIEALDTETPGALVSTFRVGMDEARWLEVNNAVFAGHPENGNMTRRDLETRIAQPWFDPEGFFLAWSDDKLVASCWTKLHKDGVGEIYIVGVSPGWEGRGLGKSLVAVGLAHLGSDRFATKAMLFVESSNLRATRLYERLGFRVARIISAYGYSPSG
jgi:mycothiol synthase